MVIISLELLLLSISILLVNLSYNLDDLIGSHLTLLILPLAGAESAVALALLVVFYPIRGTILLKILLSLYQ
jgi:NADH:ubiquinone oxidoreductase subunit K